MDAIDKRIIGSYNITITREKRACNCVLQVTSLIFCTQVFPFRVLETFYKIEIFSIRMILILSLE